MDIDHFKKVNDTFGHDVGDEVLKMVAMTLKKGIGEGEIVSRWGGEEFIVVVLAENEDMLYSIAKKLCILVEQSSFLTGTQTVSVTISVGATMAYLNDSVEILIKRADELMFQSKRLGRNQVSIKTVP